MRMYFSVELRENIFLKKIKKLEKVLVTVATAEVALCTSSCTPLGSFTSISELIEMSMFQLNGTISKKSEKMTLPSSSQSLTEINPTTPTPLCTMGRTPSREMASLHSASKTRVYSQVSLIDSLWLNQTSSFINCIITIVVTRC